MIKILFFASFRERLCIDEEALELTEDLPDVSSLRSSLSQRGKKWLDVFGKDQKVMVAINQTITNEDQLLKEGDEIAFFPPVTGG